MGISFPKLTGAVTKFVKKEEKKLVNELKEEGKEIAAGANKVKDAFVNAGGAAIGLAEMVGLKYPVKKYSAKVSDQLTRGSRLEAGDMEKLKAQGFKGVVNLNKENDNDAGPAAKNGLNALHIPILDNTPPTMGQMKQFLDFTQSPANQPVYVHCEAGKGRTGVATASYRMAVQGWTPEAAIAEAKSMGMAMPSQIAFLEKFGKELKAGHVAGYPLK